jgi:hypothetical protein
MKKPNFFIIGAPKCGTTSLVRWLDEHPNVYISPIKEPRYFDRDLGTRFRIDEKAYRALFKEARAQHYAVGEATVWYRDAVSLIEKEIGPVKYIVLVRNPVEMAYALHEQLFINQTEHIANFRIAMAKSEERRNGRGARWWIREPRLLDYQSVCSVGSQLERLLQVVPRERVLILVLDDFKTDVRSEYSKVLDYLGLSDDGRQEFPIYNPAKRVRSSLLQKIVVFLQKAERISRAKLGLVPQDSALVRWLDKCNKKHRPRQLLPNDLRREMETFFKFEVLKMEQILERDFSYWFKFEKVHL